MRSDFALDRVALSASPGESLATVRQYARDYLELRFSHREMTESCNHTLQLEGMLESVGAMELFCEGVKAFCDELADFLHGKSTEGTDSSALEEFSRSVSAELFAGGQNFGSYLRATDLFLLAARVNQVPEAQGSLGGDLLDVLILKLQSEVQEPAEELIACFLDQPLDVVLDLLHQTKTVFARAVANANWTHQVEEACIALVNSLHVLHDSPLVYYGASLARERIAREQQEPSYSFIRLPGKRREGRATEHPSNDDLKEGEFLRGQFNVEAEDLTVLRIARDGVALYDQSLIPQRLAQVALENRDGSIATEVFTAGYADLLQDPSIFPFIPQNQERVALLLKQLHHPGIRAMLKTDLGVDVRDLPLRSQVHMLRYLANQDSDGFNRVRAALHRHPGSETIILSAFLANSEHERFCEPVIRAAELLDTEQVSILFAKYGEIVDATNSIHSALATYVESSVDLDRAHVLATRGLIGKANRILELYVNYLEEVGNDSAARARVFERLSVVERETALMSTLYREIGRREGLSMEHINGLSIEARSARSLTMQEIHTLRLINEENCLQNKYPAPLAKHFSDALEEAFDDPRSLFYLLEYKGKIVSMQRFVPLDKHTMYHASFNTTVEAKGSGLGSAFFRAVVAEVRQHFDIEGAVYEKIPARDHYLQKQGFHVIEEVEDYHGTGSTVLRIGIGKSFTVSA